MEHAPVQVLVKPDIPKELLALMEEYSDMLVVLQTARLSKERLSGTSSYSWLVTVMKSLSQKVSFT